MNKCKCLLAALLCAGLCGCGWLEDDGVHLAYCLKDGAKALQRSADTELTVAFQPLDGTNQIYTVQFCRNSLVVVWCKHGGSSTYQLNDTIFSLRLHYSGNAGKEGHAEAIPLEPA